MSKLFDEEKSFGTFGLARFCHTPESFALLRKYATNPHRNAHRGASMDVEIDLMRQLLENMDEHPKVVAALNRFLDDEKYSKTTLDRNLYTFLLSVENKKIENYLDTILDNPKLYNNNYFFTYLFLAIDKNAEEIDSIVKEFSK